MPKGLIINQMISFFESFRNAILKRIGSSKTKRKIWDQEFRNGKWSYLRDPVSEKYHHRDIIYDYIEKYISGGDILDLGCGNGSTGKELDNSVYHNYTGVDISEVAIKQAEEMIKEDNVKRKKNVYEIGDILTYSPKHNYNLILFRETIYYLTKKQIVPILYKYSNYLVDDGKIVIRLWNWTKYKEIVNLILANFCVVDHRFSKEELTAVIVIRR
jgi:2-polyprenyl-3-methyl-5-hydroxy-6-metoxy-1,4-benzoquinol methylase